MLSAHHSTIEKGRARAGPPDGARKACGGRWASATETCRPAVRAKEVRRRRPARPSHGSEAGPCRGRPGAGRRSLRQSRRGRAAFEIVGREASLAVAVTPPRSSRGPRSGCWTATWRDAERTLRNQSFRRIRCMWTRRLDAVEASSGGERRALGYLGQVLVEKHAGDELLARSDADLVVEALGVVLDRVRREDQRLGDLDAR
jgi:hypothetical protein